MSRYEAFGLTSNDSLWLSTALIPVYLNGGFRQSKMVDGRPAYAGARLVSHPSSTPHLGVRCEAYPRTAVSRDKVQSLGRWSWDARDGATERLEPPSLLYNLFPFIFDVYKQNEP